MEGQMHQEEPVMTMTRRTALICIASLTVTFPAQAYQASEGGGTGSMSGLDTGFGQSRRDPGGLQDTRPGVFEGGQPLGRDKKPGSSGPGSGQPGRGSNPPGGSWRDGINHK
jgi:hypothetical protein